MERMNQHFMWSFVNILRTEEITGCQTLTRHRPREPLHCFPSSKELPERHLEKNVPVTVYQNTVPLSNELVSTITRSWKGICPILSYCSKVTRITMQPANSISTLCCLSGTQGNKNKPLNYKACVKCQSEVPQMNMYFDNSQGRLSAMFQDLISRSSATVLQSNCCCNDLKYQ